MTTNDYLRGPWQAVLSAGGDILTDLADADDCDVDITICRGSALPVRNEYGELDWPRSYSGDDEIELWDDIEPENAERRWVQAQAMAAGLNAAGGNA